MIRKFSIVISFLLFINFCSAYGNGTYGEGIYVGLYCGDNSCNNGETCSTCPSDCGTCPVESSSSGGGGYVSCPLGKIFVNGSCIFIQNKTAINPEKSSNVTNETPDEIAEDSIENTGALTGRVIEFIEGKVLSAEEMLFFVLYLLGSILILYLVYLVTRRFWEKKDFYVLRIKTSRAIRKFLEKREREEARKFAREVRKSEMELELINRRLNKK